MLDSVKIEFSFEDSVTNNDAKNIIKKMETLRKNAPYETAMAVFADAHSIEIVLTFVDSDRHVYDKMRSPLNRLIDSHKQPATYGWGVDIDRFMNVWAA